MGRPINPKSLRQRAKKLGISHSTLHYRIDPVYRARRKKIVKKSFMKYHEKRLAQQREYYRTVYKPKLKADAKKTG